MIRYEIEGGNLPVLICYPEEGQTLCTESGAMSWMSLICGWIPIPAVALEKCLEECFPAIRSF